MFPLAGGLRRLASVLKSLAAVQNYTAPAIEAIGAVSQHNETFLEAAIYFTKSLTFFLSAVLRLNSNIRCMLLSMTAEGCGGDARLCSNKSQVSCQSSGSSRYVNHKRNPRKSRTPANGFGGTLSMLYALSALPRCSLSACSAFLALSRCVVAALCVHLALCGYVKLTLSAILGLRGWVNLLI